jgi:hypothetical protein
VNYVNCHLWGVSYVGLIHFYEYFSFCLGDLVSLCLPCNVWLVFFFFSMELQFCCLLLSFVLPMSYVLVLFILYF